MSWISRLLRRKTLERDLDRELAFHLDSAEADHMKSGLPPTYARRLARIELGGLEQTKEAARDARGTRWLEDWWTDTRFALRGMIRTPGFTTAATLTLAIGIGATTAVWTITDALVRRSLPIDRPEELHVLNLAGDDGDFYLASQPMLQQLQMTLPQGSYVAGMGSTARMYAMLGQEPEPVIVQPVSGSFFPLLRVRPQLGRMIGPDDDAALGASPVVVIGDRYWARRFGRDSSIIGRTVPLNGVPMRIVGVASGFDGLTVASPVDMFFPLAMQHALRYYGNASSSNADMAEPWGPQRGIQWLTLVTRVDPAAVATMTARLAPPFRAQTELLYFDRDTASRNKALRQQLALEPLGRGFSPLRDEFADPLRTLMLSVGIVLLIACANLAGLLLARAASRTHEITVRVALGARPGRLMRQVVTESLTLAMIGGVLGLVVAHWMTRALLRLASSGSRPIPLDASLDASVLAFAFGVTLVAGLLFGLAPAVHLARSNLYEGFRGGKRVADAKHGSRVPLGRVLVAAQIALSLILVTSAGVFVRTFQHLVNTDTGYDRESVLIARIDLRAAGYTRDQLPALYDRLAGAVRVVPGVESASLSLHGVGTGSQRISGFRVPTPGFPAEGKQAQENLVSPEFFRTIGIELVSGRGFTPDDRAGAPRVAVLTEAAAKRLFGNEPPVGKRFGYDIPPELEVVGVVRDVRPNSLKSDPAALVFKPLAQEPGEYITSIEVRTTSGRAVQVASAVRAAIASVDRNLPVREVVTAADLLERTVTRERLVARLAGGFGLLALLLAAVGLYGVVSFSVSRRRNEMGIRMALGASPGGVSRMVLADTLRTVVIGLVVGALLWYPLLGLTRKLVVGLSPHDPLTFAVGAGVLLIVGALAGLLPARRAARVDPLSAIRAE
jgi:predicted permease